MTTMPYEPQVLRGLRLDARQFLPLMTKRAAAAITPDGVIDSVQDSADRP